MLVIQNCSLPDAPEGHETTDILIRDGIIGRVGGVELDPARHTVLDAEGRLVIPGLIDIHIHGAGGGDVSDGEADSLKTMSTALARMGTTGFLASGMVQPHNDSRHLRLAAENVGKDLGGARLLGLHLEGPFINTDRRGGIPEYAVYGSSRQKLDELLELTLGTLRMLTVAPEVAGVLELIPQLVKENIIAAIGHTDADYHEALKGFEAGITHTTHLYNAMPALQHRAPGPISAIFDTGNVTAELICDGHHIDPAMVRLAHRQLGSARCVCMTDGMRAMGLPDGRYKYYGQPYISEDGAARYLDGTLIGTTRSLLQMAQRFAQITGVRFTEAIDNASIIPARVLGLDHRKGSVVAGKDADLVVLSDDCAVWATIIGGQVVYREQDGSPDG